MKIGAYTVCLLLLLSLHATVFYSVSPWGIRPDFSLVAACLVGLWAGQVRGFWAGCVLGFAQDLFSAGALWLHLLTKSGVGFLSGLVAKHVSNMTVHSVFFTVLGLSFVSGLVLLLSSRMGMGMGAALHGFFAILLPQALLDGLMAIGANWAVARWMVKTPSG